MSGAQTGQGTDGTVTVRYFAGARAAAGVAEEQVDVLTGSRPLTALLDDLAARHGAELARVLASASFLVDEVPGPRHRDVPAGAVVDVLPPFAGG